MIIEFLGHNTPCDCGEFHNGRVEIRFAEFCRGAVEAVPARNMALIGVFLINWPECRMIVWAGGAKSAVLVETILQDLLSMASYLEIATVSD